MSPLLGLIVKRLPRKLDVMEGENAAFCVETREAMEGICWSRNGLQLHESPRAVLKSFGRTHLLVLVHVTREDAGIICFSVGESLTSSQLRVKCKPGLGFMGPPRTLHSPHSPRSEMAEGWDGTFQSPLCRVFQV